MRIARTLALLLGILISAARAPAWTDDLTWEKALSIARKSNPDIRSSRSSVDAAKARYMAGFSGFFPQITGGLSAAHSDTASDGATPSLDRSMNLTAQQDLFSGFGTKSSLESARLAWQGEQAAARHTEARVRDDLRSAFIEVVYGSENVSLLSVIRDRRRDNRDMIQLRYKAGRENLGSLMRAGALFRRAQFELERASRQLASARKRLARTLGVAMDQAGSVKGNFSVNLSGTRPDFSRLALETPQYLISRYQRDKARSQVTLARADFFPALSVSGTGSRRATDGGGDRDSWSAGAQVNYAFFSGAKSLNGLREARLSLEKSSADFEAVARETEVVLEETHSNFEDAAGLAQVQEEFLKAAEERAKISRAQYSNGLVSFQDWDLIESDLISAQKDALTARRGAVLAASAWDKILGRGLEAP